MVSNWIVVFCLVFAAARIDAQKCKGGAVCVDLRLCSDLYNQLRKGATPELSKLLRTLHCGFENNNPKICCPPEFDGSQSPIATTRPVAQSYFDPANPVNLLPDLNTCGLQNDDRIVGGERTDIDEFPWMVLLRYDRPRGWGFYCGGVLISPNYVLTAAHCVKGLDIPQNFILSQVRLGEWNTSTAVDCIDQDCSLPPQDIEIEKIIPHEQYDPQDTNQLHDIALLRLKTRAHFNDFVKPICLPNINELKRLNLEGRHMVVGGWGKTENRSESDVKLKVSVPVVNNNQCSNVYSRVGRRITNTQLCAGGVTGQDSCRGDSGGALMSKVQYYSNWFVFGVVSYGPSPCGTQGWPGVYTRVTEYTDWILSKLRP